MLGSNQHMFSKSRFLQIGVQRMWSVFVELISWSTYLLTHMRVFGLWFSGVFANTVHLVQMICIPLESSDHGRCFYVPFIQTRASPGSSLVQDKVFITFWEVSVLMCLFTYFLHKIQCSLDISNERKSCYMQYNSCAWVAQLFNTKVTALMNFTSVHQDNYF